MRRTRRVGTLIRVLCDWVGCGMSLLQSSVGVVFDSKLPFLKVYPYNSTLGEFPETPLVKARNAGSFDCAM